MFNADKWNTSIEQLKVLSYWNLNNGKAMQLCTDIT